VISVPADNALIASIAEKAQRMGFFLFSLNNVFIVERCGAHVKVGKAQPFFTTRTLLLSLHPASCEGSARWFFAAITVMSATAILIIVILIKSKKS
jgi:hypothetical protein